MKNKKKIILIIIGVLIVIGLAIGVVWYFNKKNSQIEKSYTNIPKAIDPLSQGYKKAYATNEILSDSTKPERIELKSQNMTDTEYIAVYNITINNKQKEFTVKYEYDRDLGNLKWNLLYNNQVIIERNYPVYGDGDSIDFENSIDVNDFSIDNIHFVNGSDNKEYIVIDVFYGSELDVTGKAFILNEDFEILEYSVDNTNYNSVPIMGEFVVQNPAPYDRDTAYCYLRTQISSYNNEEYEYKDCQLYGIIDNKIKFIKYELSSDKFTCGGGLSIATEYEITINNDKLDIKELSNFEVYLYSQKSCLS